MTSTPIAEQHPAVAEFLARHDRMPIITHLTDTDLYKFTMQQAVLHRFPGEEAEYRFRCRTPNVDLRPLADEIQLELEHLCQLQFTDQELAFLGGLRYLKKDYIEFLRIFKLRRAFVNIDASGDQLAITIKGPMLHVMPFEIYLLAIVSELHYRQFASRQTTQEGLRRLQEKIQLVRQHFSSRDEKPNFRFSDFGTRRRFSREWQGTVVRTLAKDLPHYMTGTSNVFLAMTEQLTPLGTMAHEYLQAHQALRCQLVDSQKAALESWVKEYRGDLGTALTDVIGMDAFVRDFDLYFAKLYDGVRHDSGDPYEWGERMIAHYESLRINPKTKTLVFSDALTMGKALDLYDYFHDRANTAFGIGTHLTNDLGLQPINIVIKMVRMNDKPTAKLSDSPGKTMCDDPMFIAYLKKVFKVRD